MKKGEKNEVKTEKKEKRERKENKLNFGNISSRYLYIKSERTLRIFTQFNYLFNALWIIYIKYMNLKYKIYACFKLQLMIINFRHQIIQKEY